MTDLPRLRATRLDAVSPWVTVVARDIERAGAIQTFHSIRQADYVTLLAVTRANEVVLVRQYRPAVERITLELPGGLVDGKLDPMATVARELEEETGFRSIGAPEFLGTLDPDTGRLENRFHCFFSDAVEPVADWHPEPGLERLLVPKAEFLEMIRSGAFPTALHIALVGLALLKGKF
ncbi:MAG: NUDIX hydrolase [Magnetospirillum sp.]|nr:NUDIX hydrolase [Magnetospirillum sp.]